MRKMVVTLLAAAFLLFAGSVWAESPIRLRHSVKGFDVRDDNVTYNLTLYVENTGDETWRDLTLLFAPLFSDNGNELVLNVGNLEGHRQVEYQFELVGGADIVRYLQLLPWDMQSKDEEGKLIKHTNVSCLQEVKPNE